MGDGQGEEAKGRAACLETAGGGIWNLPFHDAGHHISRESGNSKGFDLELFSTWGINDRNNAYVIENIMLFVPYGFLGSWAFEKMGNFFRCLALGALTSLYIESLQLVTGRGFFQIDDILTNTLGAVIGCLVYRLFLFCGKK